LVLLLGLLLLLTFEILSLAGMATFVVVTGGSMIKLGKGLKGITGTFGEVGEGKRQRRRGA